MDVWSPSVSALAQCLFRLSLDPDLVSVYLGLDLSPFGLKLGTFAVVSMNFS